MEIRNLYEGNVQERKVIERNSAANTTRNKEKETNLTEKEKQQPLEPRILSLQVEKLLHFNFWAKNKSDYFLKMISFSQTRLYKHAFNLQFKYGL